MAAADYIALASAVACTVAAHTGQGVAVVVVAVQAARTEAVAVADSHIEKGAAVALAEDNYWDC